MDSRELKNRTKKFALDCIRLLSAEHQNNRLFWHIENQLMRCSTSVAANYRAACLGQSRAAFVAKLSIVLEEADESLFWLELIGEQLGFKNITEVNRLKQEALELTKLFSASRKSLQINKR